MTWQDLKSAMAERGYVAADDLAAALHLALALGRPILLEGAAGVGKTEVARVLAAVRDARLIRLQCYEGLDAAHAIYEWNYQRQLLPSAPRPRRGRLGRASRRGSFRRITCWNGPSSPRSGRRGRPSS